MQQSGSMQSQAGGQLRGMGVGARASARRSRRLTIAAGWGEKLKAFSDGVKRELDFESWAPRSSQAWRMGQTPTPLRNGPRRMGDAEVEVLNQRLAQARAQSGPASREEAAEADQQSLDTEREQAASRAAAEAEEASFLASTDGDVADSLNQRISQVATSLASSDEDAQLDAGDGGGGAALDGAAMRDLMLSKWGKAHDVSFVRNNLPLGKTLVCLNVYSPFLGQRSFKMTEGDYLERLDGIALCLQAWGQAGKVRSFLSLPAKPRKGLPAKPIIGTAVSIQLDLDDATIAEWFPER